MSSDNEGASRSDDADEDATRTPDKTDVKPIKRRGIRELTYTPGAVASDDNVGTQAIKSATLER